MPTPAQYSGRMRQQLRVTMPDLDTSIGTPVRKIIDAVGEQLAEASADSYLLDYQYDIDAKFGADLDDFVRLFGFSRLPARRSTGQVTFYRTTPATETITLPVNTQVSTSTAPQVIVATVTPAVIGVGDTQVTVPAQAIVAGSAGNIPALSLDLQLTSIQGVSSFANTVAFTGGTDAESDDALRNRFKKTVFRSMAGTEAMFAGTALEDPDVSEVNVIGASKRHSEQIELVSGEATSTVTGARYIYPDSSFFGVDIEAGDIFKEGVHYDFDATVNPPEIDSLSAAVVPDGVYELAFEFVPLASRNDGDNNITNRVDVWLKGTRAQEASETLIFSTSKVFQDSVADDPWYTGDYEREDESPPDADNYFIPYSFVPLINPTTTDELIIDGVTYERDTHFFMVHRKDAFGYSPQSFAGIEFVSVANGASGIPPNNEPFPVTYAFNSVPLDVQTALQRWRLVTVDVWAHQARLMLLELHFAVILEQGYSLSSVRDEMIATVGEFISRVSFNSILQASDLLAVAHGVTGVDAIRFLTSTDDPTNYAIQRVDSTGAVQETFQSGGRATDVFTTDDAVPVLNDITLVAKAPNTFGTV